MAVDKLFWDLDEMLNDYLEARAERKKENKLQEKLDKIAKELREVREEIVSIEQPDLKEATLTIKALRKSKGGKGIKAEPGSFGVKMI